MGVCVNEVWWGLTKAEIIQSGSIIALVLITWYYAWLTRRQADLMERARQDITLKDLLTWAGTLHKIISSAPYWDTSEKIGEVQDSLTILLNESLVLMGACRQIDPDLSVEILRTSEDILRLAECLNRFADGKFPEPKDLAEEIAIGEALWKHGSNIRAMVSKLKAR